MAKFSRYFVYCLCLCICPIITYAQLHADFQVLNNGKTDGCPPFAVTFQSTSTGTNSSTTYTWNFGKPPISTVGPIASTTYLSPGTYTVTLTIANGSSSSFVSKTAFITVHDTPSVNFSGNPLSGCPGTTVNFTNSSTPGSSGGTNAYTWYFGVPPSSTLTNPSFQYNATGTYNVTLQATNSWGCIASKTKPGYVVISTKPTANFTGSPTSACSPPLNVNFSGTASGGVPPYTYTWDFGSPPAAGTGQTPPPHTYTGWPQNYDVKLVVTDNNGCKDSMLKPAYIKLIKVDADFTAPSSVCIGTPVTFNNTTTPAPTSVSWDLGPAGTTTVTSPTVTFYTAGTFNIRLISNYLGCLDTQIKSITINPQPLVDFTTKPDSPCPAPQAIQFIPNASYSNYIWDFGDFTGQNTNASPTHTYTANGYYSPTLIVTNSNGCKDTITKVDSVRIHNLWAGMYATDTMGCTPLTVTFMATDSTSIPNNIKRRYPYGIRSWLWDFGVTPTVTSTAATPTFTYPTQGVYYAKVRITTNNGCIAYDTLRIKTGLHPTASFTANPTRICNRKDVTFTCTSTDPCIDEWIWKFGDGNTGYGPSAINKYMWPGKYSVTLIVGCNGCYDTLRKINYITVDSSGSEFAYFYSCDTPNKVRFANQSVGWDSLRWYFGDGQNSNVVNPTHFFPTAANTYNVMLVTFNNTTGCSDTQYHAVIIRYPVTTFTADDTTICKGEKVRFTGALANATAKKFFWWINDAYYSDSLPSYTHQFFNTGLYKVKLQVLDERNCYDSLVKYDYVLVSKPNVSFTGSPLSGCVPLTVNFTDASTPYPGTSIAARFWDFSSPPPLNATSTNVSKTFTASGNYDIKLVITDNIGCKDSMVRVGYVAAHKPTASFSVKDSACVNEGIVFSNLSSNFDSSFWYFGDNSAVSKDQSPTHAYAQPGVYTVTLVVKDVFGCLDTMTIPNKVYIVKPHATFTMSDSVSACPILNVIYTNTSTGGYSYAWQLGSGNTINSLNASELFTSAGYYTIRLIVTNKTGCSDTAYGHVNMLGYSGAISYNPLTGCVPLTVNFTPNVSNVATLLWDFNDGVTVPTTSASPITHTYASPGAFVPRLILGDNKGCSASTVGKDTIKVDQIYPGFTTGPACEGSQVEMIDTSKGYFTPPFFWKWTFDDGSVSNKQKPTHYYGAPGKYPVKMYVMNTTGCVDSITQDIVINSLPVIQAGTDTTICLKDSATLYPSGGVSYAWSPSNYLSCTNCTNPKAAPVIRFKYVVEGTDGNGCKNKDTVEVNIKTKVTSVASPDGDICDLDTLQLNAKGARNYVWSPGEALNATDIPNPIARPHNTITYKVIGYEASCIPDTDFVKVTVHPLPTVKANGEATIIAGNSTVLQANGTLIKRFMWKPAESLSCSDCPDPTASPTKTTNFVVTVYTDFGCADSDYVKITVLCDKSQMFIPNTFTPNGDGENDIFYPRGNGVDQVKSFRVYNRWGEIVFERTNMKVNDKSIGWDGNFRGNVLPPDVFVYLIEVVCEGGDIMKIKGDVTLIR